MGVRRGVGSLGSLLIGKDRHKESEDCDVSGGLVRV